MLLACHKKSYLICDKITNFRNIMWVLFIFMQLSLGCLSFVFWKKIENRLREYLKIHNFITYQITFLMTYQQHKKSSFLHLESYAHKFSSSILLSIIEVNLTLTKHIFLWFATLVHFDNWLMQFPFYNILFIFKACCFALELVNRV